MYYKIYLAVKTICVTLSRMSHEIRKTDTGNHKAQRQEAQSDNQSVDVYAPRRWSFVLAASVLVSVAVCGGYLIWWLSAAFADMAARATFIMGSALNLGILLAVVAQACIYWGQRNLMAQQWDVMKLQRREMSEQLKATQDMAQVSIAGSRPYLDINAVLMFLPDDPVKIEINFLNNGQSEATVSADYEIVIKGSINATKTGSFEPFAVAPAKYETKRIGKISIPELHAIQQYTARISLRINGSYSGLGKSFPIAFCKTYAKLRGMAIGANHLPLAQACENEDR